MYQRSIQKNGAILGLIASIILVVYLIVQIVSVKWLTDVTPASLVQWTIDHQFLLFFTPLLVIAMLLYSVLLQAIKERLKDKTPHLASLSFQFGWMTLLVITLMLLAEWFHIYLNAVVWDQEVAHQFSRLTFNTIQLLHIASLPFFAGWLMTTGLGALLSKGFSKAFSWVTIVVASLILVDFIHNMWDSFISVPFLYVLSYLSSIYFVVWLVWASIELLKNIKLKDK